MTASLNVTKDPDAVKDYAVDWERWLDGDTISTSTWIAEAGLTVDSDSNTTTRGACVISGGTAGETYRLTNRIVTVAGWTEDRSIMVTVKET